MKIRKGFVSNSSSSSFAIPMEELLNEIDDELEDVKDDSEEQDGENMKYKNQNVFRWWVVNHPKDATTINNLDTEVTFQDVLDKTRVGNRIGDIIFKKDSEMYGSNISGTEIMQTLVDGMKEAGYPVDFLRFLNKKNEDNCELQDAQELYNMVKL